jgi:hypothetical protein
MGRTTGERLVLSDVLELSRPLGPKLGCSLLLNESMQNRSKTEKGFETKTEIRRYDSQLLDRLSRPTRFSKLTARPEVDIQAIFLDERKPAG